MTPPVESSKFCERGGVICNELFWYMSLLNWSSGEWCTVSSISDTLYSSKEEFRNINVKISSLFRFVGCHSAFLCLSLVASRVSLATVFVMLLKDPFTSVCHFFFSLGFELFFCQHAIIWSFCHWNETNFSSVFCAPGTNIFRTNRKQHMLNLEFLTQQSRKKSVIVDATLVMRLFLFFMSFIMLLRNHFDLIACILGTVFPGLLQTSMKFQTSSYKVTWWFVQQKVHTQEVLQTCFQFPGTSQ